MLLACALLAPSMAIAAPNPLTPEQARARIRGIGVGNLVGVQLRNGTAYAGKIVSIDENSFALQRYGEEQPTPVAYSDVVYLQVRLSVAYLSRRPVTPETVHARLLKRGLGKWVGVQLLNGVAFCGAIVSIDDNSFALQLWGDPEVTPVAYNDVVYLQTGFTSGQKAFLIALPVAFAGAAIGGAVAFHNSEPKMPTMPTQPIQPIFP
jgi:small nuclear ribonucleoprotein (snRNP)-like protein